MIVEKAEGLTMTERILASAEIARDVTSFSIPEGTTTIGLLAFDGCPKLVVRTPEGSYAESWARTNKVKFETITVIITNK